jgi:hypothetical protein
MRGIGSRRQGFDGLAKSRNPAETPKQTPDDEPLRQVAESRRLLARHKRRHQQRLEAGDDQAAVAELEAIAGLEVRLWNLESLLRVRSLTRLPRRPARWRRVSRAGRRAERLGRCHDPARAQATTAGPA